jgi:hypothetical protein
VELWGSIYGPMQRVLDGLRPEAREQLVVDLLALADRFNVATDGTMVAPAEYLEVVVRKPVAGR